MARGKAGFAASVVCAALALLASGGLSAAAAETAPGEAPTEYEVKAAFIYNFARFVDWPARPGAPAGLALCVVGKDPFGRALDALEGKAVGDRKLQVRRVPEPDSLAGCDIVFISASEQHRLAAILRALRSSPALTIGDTQGFAQQGVMINFYLEGDRVRFEVNPDSATDAGVRISSKLLRLGRLVGERG
jgi:hypothetical protein